MNWRLLKQQKRLLLGLGCLRSRIERQLWHDMTTEQRREVLRLVSGRKLRIEQMKQRKGQQLGFDFEEVAEVMDCVKVSR